MDFDISDAEYVGIDKEIENGDKLHEEKYSVNMVNDLNFTIKGQEVRKAYYNQAKREMSFSSILKPVVDTYNLQQMHKDLELLLGTKNFIIKNLEKGQSVKKELNLINSFGTAFKGGQATYKYVMTGELKENFTDKGTNFKIAHSRRMSGRHAAVKEDARQSEAFYAGNLNEMLSYVCKKDPSILNDPYVATMFLNADVGRKSKTPLLYHEKNLRPEMKGWIVKEKPCPLLLGLSTIEKKKGEPGFILINAKTSAQNRDGGNKIQDTTLSSVGAYNKTMLNLIVTLFSQVFKFVKGESIRHSLYLPNGIIHH